MMGALLLLGLLSTVDQNMTGWLHVTVMDQSGSLVPGIPMEITSAGGATQAKSNAEGRLDVAQTPGVVQIIFRGANTLPLPACTLEIKAGEHKYVVVRPVFRGSSDSEKSEESVHIDAIDVPNIHAAVLIRYSAKVHRGGQDNYTGRHVMISYDHLAVYSDRVVCIHASRCTAIGHVRADIGMEHLEGLQADIDLASRNFHLYQLPDVSFRF